MYMLNAREPMFNLYFLLFMKDLDSLLENLEMRDFEGLKQLKHRRLKNIKETLHYLLNNVK